MINAVEMVREGVPLNVIQRQLGHADLGVTSVYLQVIDNTEVISTIRAPRTDKRGASDVSGSSEQSHFEHGGSGRHDVRCPGGWNTHLRMEGEPSQSRRHPAAYCPAAEAVTHRSASRGCERAQNLFSNL